MLPFSREVYFSLFGELNTAHPIWTGLSFIIALGLLGCILRPKASRAGRTILFVGLALLWLGTAYFWYFKVFAEIHFLADVYGLLAVLQALALCGLAFGKHSTNTIRKPDYLLWLPLLLALAWPLIDLLAGPGWPCVRMLGLHPLPLILLSFAILPFLSPLRALCLGCIPFLFSLSFAYQAYVLQMPSDWLPLLVALGLTSVFFKARH